jgi:hypothetical protein
VRRDDEIAGRLERAGYRPRDDVLVNEDDPGGGPASFPAVGGEDGVVVLAGDAQTVRRTLDGEQPDGPRRRLLNEVDAPVRDATTLGAGGDTCVRGIALGDSVDPAEGELIVSSGRSNHERGPALAGPLRLLVFLGLRRGWRVRHVRQDLRLVRQIRRAL